VDHTVSMRIERIVKIWRSGTHVVTACTVDLGLARLDSVVCDVAFSFARHCGWGVWVDLV